MKLSQKSYEEKGKTDNTDEIDDVRESKCSKLRLKWIRVKRIFATLGLTPSVRLIRNNAFFTLKSDSRPSE